MLRLEYTLHKETRDLMRWPVSYMPIHLSNIKMNQFLNQDLIETVKSLYWLFGTEKGATSFVKANLLDSIFDRILDFDFPRKLEYFREITQRGLELEVNDTA
ncbi:hypothetical protein PgNI_10131 [Pyricularia grisea]|uniref:Uncharacterized protein n=1 Tax=Pyricularia grisea TaxID=148305 RepID=A0A6P8AZX2_PYRGI|nr:hypothetical protein PgNI_10131 [Pyricularia grisea]TLD07864.1 hypothetical protein PgNI_10131 [Pyricularia grisea]